MIIGLCGFKSSGKDTIANYLVQQHGFKRLTFASAVKDILSIIFGWPRDRLEGLTQEDREWREQIDPWWSTALNIPTLSPRFTMQYLATDLFRNHFHPDIWVKIIQNQLNQNENIVISDCRFHNEINMILRNQGKIIHIHRNTPKWFYKYRQGIDVDEVKNIHCSEIEWIRCYSDYDIENNDSITELHDKIKHIFEKLLKDN